METILKRSIDMLVSAVALVLSAPIITTCSIAIWIYDWHSPLFLQKRIGKTGKPFTLYKLRSMTVHQKAGTPDTTSRNDPRLTPIGKFIRRYKLDELPQFYNVFIGNMSLVGPRPQIPSEVALYTAAEMELLEVRPGITDLSSIVFIDLEEIAAAQPNADKAYHQLVRPWKGRLGVFYVRHGNILMDLVILKLTILVMFDRRRAWTLLSNFLKNKHAPLEIVNIASRNDPLQPTEPLGA